MILTILTNRLSALDFEGQERRGRLEVPDCQDTLVL